MLSSPSRRGSRKASIQRSINTHVKVSIAAYPLEEFREIPIDDGLNNLSVHVGQPDTQVGSHDKEACEDDEVEGLLGFVGGDRDLKEFFDSCEENLIYVTFASLYKSALISFALNNLIDGIDPIY